MDKRPVLRLRRGPIVVPASLSVLDAAFITILFVVAAASLLQVSPESLSPFKKAAAAEAPARIVVWVHGAGTIDVNGVAVAPDALAPRLRDLIAIGPGAPVRVVADGPADARVIARALEAARLAGANQVSVARVAG
jgi:biopolymer transport protein ExbD